MQKAEGRGTWSTQIGRIWSQITPGSWWWRWRFSHCTCATFCWLFFKTPLAICKTDDFSSNLVDPHRHTVRLSVSNFNYASGSLSCRRSEWKRTWSQTSQQKWISFGLLGRHSLELCHVASSHASEALSETSSGWERGSWSHRIWVILSFFIELLEFPQKYFSFVFDDILNNGRAWPLYLERCATSAKKSSLAIFYRPGTLRHATLVSRI